MLFCVLGLVVILISALICRRLCVGASAGHLVAVVILSLAVSGFWFMHGYPACIGMEHAKMGPIKWKLVDLAFHGIFFALPLSFVSSFALLMTLRQKKKPRPSGVVVTVVSTAFLSLAVGHLVIGIYATQIEPNLIQVTHTEIRTPKLKSGAPPLRILQLSDLHIERIGYREECALRIVEQSKPDMILLTGDYTNGWEYTPDVQRFMKGLHARYGVYAVNGNWNPGPKSARFFDGSDVRLIEDRSTVVRIPSGRLELVGVKWTEGKSQHPRVPNLRGDALHEYVVVLCHVPDLALHAPAWADLILSGHTHGGQIRLPGIGPIVTLSAIPRNRAAGLSKLGNGGYLYVNRGLGMEGGWAPRIRFLCRPEISIITVRPK